MTDFTISDFSFEKTAQKVTMFMEYKFLQTVGRVVVQFKTSVGEILDTQYVDIPADIYATWTSTDQYLIDYVATQLGITIVTP